MSDLEDLRHHAGIVNRLRAFGSHPVDPVVAARHAALMSSVEREAMAPRRRFRPVLVGGLVAGTLFGSVGLAGAITGSVPAPARAVLQSVGIMDRADDDAPKTGPAKGDDVETPRAEAAGPGAEVAPGEGGVERSLEDCPEGFTGTHGQWVASQPQPSTTDENERRQAAQEDCGKPAPSVDPPSPPPGESPGRGTPGGPPDAPRHGDGPPADTGPGDAGRPPHAGSPSDVGTGGNRDVAPGPPSAPGNRPAGAGAGKGVAGP